jgi:plastocyanin
MLSKLTLLAAAVSMPAARAGYISVTAIGHPSDGWSVSGNGCNVRGGSCDAVEYEDIHAEVGDVLLFQYMLFHDVWQHSSIDSGNACNFNDGGSRVGSSSAGNRYSDGKRGYQHELTTPGSFVFSCTRAGNRPGWPSIGSHCQKGQSVHVFVTDPSALSADTQTTNVAWIIKDYEDMAASVGDTVCFQYSSGHNVFVHPSGTCDRSGASQLGSNSAGGGDGACHTFTEEGSKTFACQVGSHCNFGQIVTVNVGAASGSMYDPSSGGEQISCDAAGCVTHQHDIEWIITDYSQMTAAVGDTVTFHYSSFHNVFLHPTGTCDRAGASELGDTQAGYDGASHTFTEAGTYTFACQVGDHCSDGQIVTFVVTGGSTAAACPTDLNNDGMVNVNDVLQIMSQFGRVSSADLTGDGIVDVSDVLEMLTAFGSTCAGTAPPPPPCDNSSPQWNPSENTCCPGDQVFSECAAAEGCRPVCGREAGQICNFMCYQACVCPENGSWDQAANRCAATPDLCTGGGGGDLPPGVAIGRPFVVKEQAATAELFEVASDWAL